MLYNGRSFFGGFLQLNPIVESVYNEGLTGQVIPPPFAQIITTEDDVWITTENDIPITTQGEA